MIPEARSARARSSISIAARWSALLTIAYLLNIAAVFHGPMAITTDSSPPPITLLIDPGEAALTRPGF